MVFGVVVYACFKLLGLLTYERSLCNKTNVCTAAANFIYEPKPYIILAKIEVLQLGHKAVGQLQLGQ